MAAFETALAPVSLSPVVMQAVALGVEQDQITTFFIASTGKQTIQYIIQVWLLRLFEPAVFLCLISNINFIDYSIRNRH